MERKQYLLTDGCDETRLVSLTEDQVRLIYWLNERLGYDFSLEEQYEPEEV